MDVLPNSLFCLLLALTSIFIIAAKISRGGRSKSKRLPPGPRPLPLIGNLHQLGPKPHRSLSALARTHGPIMSLRLGQVPAIIISSAPAAKQVLQKLDQSFAHRAVPECLHACGHAEVSVGWGAPVPKWRELRKICSTYIFSHQRIQDMEELRNRKVRELVEDVGASASLGDAVAVGEATFKASLNVLSTALLSVNLAEAGSDIGREFKESFMSIMKLAGVPNLVDYYPWLSRVDPQRIRARMGSHVSKLLAQVDGIIGERLAKREELGAGFENGDVLDTLLDIVRDSPDEMITRNDINHLLLDLFVGGTDTTASTIEWAMSEMLKNPKSLSKAKAEMEEGRHVEDTDIPRLPYLQAIVKETLRLHPPLPLIPRRAVDDVELCGFLVPKDTKVLISTWAIGRDGDAWESPECFNPERFLGSQVDVKGVDFDLIPFGSGRRICPGLPLAYKMIHLLLGSLVNCFEWRFEGGVEDEDTDEVFGFSLQKARPLRLVASPI
uniref:Cytochrome P450 n=1 Tax=Kalanchoe fedtschenkoi TaxID=63787 RepID=A0A7N0V789_KALFE